MQGSENLDDRREMIFKKKINEKLFQITAIHIMQNQ